MDSGEALVAGSDGGAATSLWSGVIANADEVGGKYCEDCHVAEVIPADSSVSPISRGVRWYALDPENAKRLWKKGEEMVGEVFSDGFSRRYEAATQRLFSGATFKE